MRSGAEAPDHDYTNEIWVKSTNQLCTGTKP